MHCIQKDCVVASGGAEACYELFGFSLYSEFAFSTPLLVRRQPIDLSFVKVRDISLSLSLEGIEPIYTSPFATLHGQSLGCLYRLDSSCLVVQIRNAGNFFLWPDIIAYDRIQDVVNFEHHFLSTAMVLWLELRGIPVLHASAVTVGDNNSAGFLASSGHGKSALAASFMQIGSSLVTDDLLPIRYSKEQVYGVPSYPQMRMWPDEAEFFLGCYEDLVPVLPTSSKRRVPVGLEGFGTFCDIPQPLVCIYVPMRQNRGVMEDGVEITPITPRDALIELVRHSFTPRVVEALGLQSQRLDFFAQLVQQVSVRRLVYPSGLEHLPRVRDAILEDVAELQ